MTSQGENSSNNTLKMENFELSKQLDELKMAYDELKDEKTQLYLSFNDLKNKQAFLLQPEPMSNAFTQSKEIVKLNSLLKVSLVYYSGGHLTLNYFQY
jgi:regulator of replication initiation timing